MGFCNNPVSKVGDIAIAVSTPFDELDQVANAFPRSIGDPLIKVVENGIPPTLQCPDECQKLIAAKLLHFTDLCLKKTFCLLPVRDVLKDAAKSLLELIQLSE